MHRSNSIVVAIEFDSMAPVEFDGIEFDSVEFDSNASIEFDSVEFDSNASIEFDSSGHRIR